LYYETLYYIIILRAIDTVKQSSWFKESTSFIFVARRKAFLVMLEVRGKFIRLAGRLMTLYPEQRKKADAVLAARTGKHWDELNPAECYEADLYKVFLDTYCESSVTGEKALITLGRNIFPAKSSTSPGELS